MNDLTAVITTKAESVRVELKNEDYLKFNDLNGRLIFNDKEITQRKLREETFKFSLRFTSIAIHKLLNNPNAGLFVQADENKLLASLEDHIVAPFFEKKKKVDALLNSLEKLASKADPETGNFSVSSEEWSAIMSKVTDIKDLAF